MNNYSPVLKCNMVTQAYPYQCQRIQPGLEYIMSPRPVSEDPRYIGTGKLKDKIALITGGDSGIGRAVAYAFAKEGADIAIAYLCPYELRDAEETKRHVEQIGRHCLLMSGDLSSRDFCNEVVRRTVEVYGRIDILVNNAGVFIEHKRFEDTTNYELKRLFSTNIMSFFYLTKAALPYMQRGSAVINTASSSAYTAHSEAVAYAATKGAIVSFTRSLAGAVVKRGIRVNAIAPGPIWTPLVPSTHTSEEVAFYGKTPPIVPLMQRAAEPWEVAPSFVFLASDRDSSYVTGETIHVNGGLFVGG